MIVVCRSRRDLWLIISVQVCVCGRVYEGVFELNLMRSIVCVHVQQCPPLSETRHCENTT